MVLRIKKPSNNLIRNSLLVITMGVIFFHFFTLSFSPMPWFDEVLFASVTKGYLETKSFHLLMAPYYSDKEVLAYGPIYFWLTSISSKLFGFGTFQIRIINFLAALGVLFICHELIRKFYTLNPKVSLLVISTILLSPVFHSSSHSGRMDFVALSFALGSFYFLLKSLKSTKSWSLIVSSAIFAGFAVLTTPRIAVLLIPLALLLLWRWGNERNRKRFLEGILWAIVIILLYTPWVYFKFGSIKNLLAYYGELTDFVGGNSFKLPLTEWPFFLLCGISLLILFIKKPIRQILNDELLLISLLSILFFHGIVTLISIHYLGIIIPYYGFLLAAALNIKYEHRPRLRLKYVLLIIYAGYLAFFVVKMVFLISDYPLRNPRVLNDFLSKKLPENSNVVGDYQFFYGIEKRKSRFISYEYFKLTSKQEVFQYIQQKKNVNYLLLSKQSLLSGKGKELLIEDHWKKIGTLDIPVRKSILSKWLPSNVINSFAGELYLRTDKE